MNDYEYAEVLQLHVEDPVYAEIGHPNADVDVYGTDELYSLPSEPYESCDDAGTIYEDGENELLEEAQLYENYHGDDDHDVDDDDDNDKSAQHKSILGQSSLFNNCWPLLRYRNYNSSCQNLQFQISSFCVTCC